MGKRKRISREIRRFEKMFRAAAPAASNRQDGWIELETGDGFETAFRPLAPEDVPRRVAELRAAAAREGGLLLGPERLAR